VFAHNVHANDLELDLLASTGAWVAHCPTSNAALGSGLFPLRRHIEHGARVALGSDVGGGTGFSMIKEGLQAYFMQQLLGPAGLPLTRPTCSISAPGPAPKLSAGRPRRGPAGRQGFRRHLAAAGRTAAPWPSC
jgi:cytosine/adenosine deaminase-related metal-dependent hydrolase